jgi:uncharacterized protein
VGEHRSVAVAYSGGVDSTVLAKVAHDVLGDRALACIAASPSLPSSELDAARRVAAIIGIRLTLVGTDEVEREEYAKNTPDRCYVCKGVVFAELRGAAQRHGCDALFYGANADDRADYRPGGRAAAEAGVRAPLAEVGLTKAEIRDLARHWGLPNWDKPSAACLASRVPYGQRVTVEILGQLERAEAGVAALGFGQLRVRHHGMVARLELPLDDLPRALEPGSRERIVAVLREAGFRYVTIDLEGFRSGSLNAGLSEATLAASANGAGLPIVRSGPHA